MSSDILQPEHVIGFTSTFRNVASGWRGQYLYHALGRVVVRTSIQNPNEQITINGYNSNVSCLAISPNGELMATGEAGMDSDILVWDLTQGDPQLLYRFCEHDRGVVSLSFSPDSQFLLTVGAPGANSCFFIEARTGAIVTHVPPGAQTVTAAEFGPRILDEKGRATDCYRALASTATDSQQWAFNPATGSLSRQVVTGLHRVATALVSDPAGKGDFIGSETGEIFLVSPTGQSTCVAQLRGAVTHLLADAVQSSAQRVGYHTYAAALIQSTLLAATSNGDIVSYKSEPQGLSLSLVYSHSFGSRVTTLARDGASGFIVGTADGTLRHLSADGSSLVLSVNHTARITALAFYPTDPALFVSASTDGYIRLWDSADFACVVSIPPAPEGVPTALTFAESLLLVGYQSGAVVAYEVESGERLWTVEGGDRGAVLGLRAEKNARGEWLFFVAGSSGEARIWSLRHRTLVATLKEHRRSLTALETVQMGEFLVTAAEDRTVLLWSVEKAQRLAQLRVDAAPGGVAVSPDARTILVSSGNTILLWDVYNTGRASSLPLTFRSPVTCTASSIPAISEGGEVLLAVGEENGVDFLRWKPESGAQYPPYSVGSGLAHCAPITAVAVSPDGSAAITADDDGAIMVWIP